MARRKLRRSTLFTVIAVIGLLSLGIGYAAWTQNLTINGTVETATLDVHWSTSTIADDTNFDPLSVGVCTATVNGLDDNVLDVALTNAYPGFQCVVNAVVKNDSTVPVIAQGDPTFTGNTGKVTTTIGTCDIDTTPIGVGATGSCAIVFEINPATVNPGEPTLNVSSTVTFELPNAP